jgi:hypothetical protein
MEIPDWVIGTDSSGLHFLLKAADAASGAGIAAGDWVVVRSQQEVQPGQVAVTFAGGDVRICSGELSLSAPVIGVVVSVLRRYPASTAEEN